MLHILRTQILLTLLLLNGSIHDSAAGIAI